MTRRKLATAPQIHRLNLLGRLGDVVEPDGRVYADRCYELLAELAEQGVWQPRNPTQRVCPILCVGVV